MNEKIRNIIIEILKKHGVKRASIFGSYAENYFTESSDIDILIEFENDDKSLLDLIEIKQELEEKLNKRVDLLTYEAINPKLKDTILSTEKILYD